MKPSEKLPDQKGSSPLIMLVMGMVFVICGVLFFFFDHRIVVAHPAGKYTPATEELVDHQGGVAYAIFFTILGAFLMYVYIRIRRDPPVKRRRQRRQETEDPMLD
ncbi:hypothetical protein BH11VER1_BH11VER1_04840 [soil metagenome]